MQKPNLGTLCSALLIRIYATAASISSPRPPQFSSQPDIPHSHLLRDRQYSSSSSRMEAKSPFVSRQSPAHLPDSARALCPLQRQDYVSSGDGERA